MDEKTRLELKPVQLTLGAVRDLPCRPFDSYAQMDQRCEPVFATCNFWPQQFGAAGRITTRAVPHSKSIRFEQSKVRRHIDCAQLHRLKPLMPLFRFRFSCWACAT